MIETDRLILRALQDRDRAEIAAVNGDPQVGAWLSKALTRAESDEMVDRILAEIAQHGFGFWAVERKADRAVIGLRRASGHGRRSAAGTGAGGGLAPTPAAWGQGWRTEAARAAVLGFANRDAGEIVSDHRRLQPRLASGDAADRHGAGALARLRPPSARRGPSAAPPRHLVKIKRPGLDAQDRRTVRPFLITVGAAFLHAGLERDVPAILPEIDGDRIARENRRRETAPGGLWICSGS